MGEGDPGAGRGAVAFSVAVIVAFAAQPFAAFYEAHESQILAPGRLVLYAVLTAAVALAAWALLVRFTRWRPVEALALAVAAVLLSFFSFSLWLSADPRGAKVWVQLVLWLVVTAVGAFLAFRFARLPAVRFAVLVFGVVFLALPLVGALLPEDDREAARADVLPPLDADAVDERPDVYWFVLDSYGRADQLEAVLDLDTTPFTDALDERGFDVSDDSMGSYAHTHLSLASTLGMDYLVEPGNEINDAFATLGPVVRGDNETVRRFHDLGYQYVYSPQGWLPWSACDERFVDVCLTAPRARLGAGEVELTLLELTPVGSVDVLGLPFTDPTMVVDALDERTDEIEEPFFLFAHINTPHWPYRYDEGCEPREVPLDAQKLTLEERMRWYAQDVECLNPLVVEAVDRIVADDPDAIVVVQSDHGSDFYADYDRPPGDWDAAALDEHFAVLNAIRLPERCGDLTLDGEPLVNTFRVVFACIEGHPPELLPWRAFLSPLDQIQAIEELAPERFTSAG